MLKSILILVALYVLNSCKQVREIADAVVQPSPREVYSRKFSKDNGDFIAWKKAFQLALRDSLNVALPYLEVGLFTADDFLVHSYNTTLREGRQLVVALSSTHDTIPVFIEIFKLTANGNVAGAALLSKKSLKGQAVEFRIEETGRYKISLQSGLDTSIDFKLEIYTEPSFGFPVAGVYDRAIQSFWGDSRSGGKRTHEGVDIFAPKLTPVIAVSDGRIGYTGEKGLGGKQVWLREGLFRKSFYYAHLDSINVTTTDKVTLGDTLGFIGNTGNAIRTAPHLHFGIYTAGGAIDPLPFISSTQRVERDVQLPSSKAFITSKNANLRPSPNLKSKIIKTLQQNDSLTVLGKTIDWYHVRTKAREKGFIYESLLKEFDSEQTKLTTASD